jgi:hypothetical protein
MEAKLQDKRLTDKVNFSKGSWFGQRNKTDKESRNNVVHVNPENN